MIRVQPAAARIRAFAQWAIAQDPKVRTVSTHEFAVPAERFAEAPEDILLGALVEGQPYVPAAGGQGAADAPAGDGAPPAASPAGTQPDPADEAPEEPASDPAPVLSEAAFPCGTCDRHFGTERGRDTHRRQAHQEA
ncbi:hypothetical protein AB0F92_22740 [Kitasatospora aureofaciens]|uniref:hypothetical protein n=1 Tax=Kitasatospora aureofaciens TaxID=1894 RepID=UPI000D1B9D0B|nr:hypothetical protein CP971_05575 [Streptomyces viridifaciens]UKZ04840.1 hypothetical protein BOQ63_012445 [Streptomyces viridifaciens]